MADLIEILVSATTEFYSPLVTTFNGIELVFSAGIFELYVPRLSVGNTMNHCYDYTIDFDGRPLSGNSIKFFVGHLFNAHMIFIKDRPDHFAKYRVIDCLNMYKFIDMYLLPLAARGSNHNKHNYIGNDKHHKTFDDYFVLYKKICGTFYDVELPSIQEYDCTVSEDEDYSCIQEDVSDVSETSDPEDLEDLDD